ncbi:Bud site selection protein [Wickerhamomyces ciferrii]|uniref:Bud site selection protein n=1 Tax=Wickerhamomyces ciferrii (strain ATCC 14091 / BCRC 22168 / CBS 111 / JCM 3599 / NBRC 0793 / NRRL Y-1031 F-60-10) TaxID=1206466 RepID=K0KEB8_WICCF|nr:Bud site selection protein [Wickerhamomyces ciferrii]CCH40592.1 Bud site selection protein [Wickerhamomyces ciferrii]
MAKLDFGAPLIPNIMAIDDSDNESIDESHSLIKKERHNHSVDDLLHAIDKNISSASFHSDSLLQFNSNSFNSDASDDPSPIKPLSFKQQHQQHQQNLNDILNSVQDFGTPMSENIMQEIPRAPSFDELEFNTKVNRTSSLSRLSGPRKLSSSSISRTLSNKLPNSTSYKSISGQTTRDNSPSKKSVCFENSPPKIMEYEEFTPEHSDSEQENQSSSEQNDQDPFSSNWKASVKSTIHPLPPLPPKHSFGASVSSPTKDTSLGSLDGSFEDENNENIKNIELTKSEIDQDKRALTLEKKLDLVLSSSSISERVQNDEITRGSNSPSKPLTKKEEDLIYNIQTKQEIEAEQSLRDAANLFEVDLRNNDKDSRNLALAPELKRRNSNNSLRDEERELTTTVVQNVEAPLISDDGLKSFDSQHGPQESYNNSNDDLISYQSALTNNDTGSFESATEILHVKTEDNDELDQSVEEDEGPIDEDTNQESFMRSLDKSSDYESNNSIATLRDDNTPTPNTHKKKLSLSESINSGLSYISSFGRNVKGVMHRRTESGNVAEGLSEDYANIKKEEEEKEVEIPKDDDKFMKPALPSADTQDIQSSQSSITESTYETPRNSIEPSSDLNIESNIGSSVEPGERLPLLDNQTAEPTPQLSSDESQNDETIDLLDLQPPFKITDGEEDEDSSFSDEFKETALFNVSGSSQDGNYLPTGLQIQFNDKQEDEIPTDELDEDSLNDIEDSIRSNNSSFLKYEPEPEEFEQSFHQEIKKEDFEEEEEEKEEAKHYDSEDDDEDFVTPTLKTDHDLKPQQPEIKRELPSFNSTLFDDKVPDDEDDELVEFKTPPTDYISIWHNLPKSASPKPQYSTSLRKVSPPQRVLKLLNRRISSSGHSDVEESKRNSMLSEGSFDLSRRNSLITTSASKPSFIRVNSRNSLLSEVKKEDISSFSNSLRPQDSSIYTNRSLREEGPSFLAERSLREQDSIVNSSNISGNLSDLKLPEYNNSSDFASAFKDWAVEDQVDNTNVLKELERDETDNLAAAKRLKDPTNPEDIKNIWENGSNERTPTPDREDKSRTPSIDAGKLKNFIEQNGVKGENANIRSSEALGEVTVTKDEYHGIDLEFDQDSHFTSVNNSKYEPQEFHKVHEEEDFDEQKEADENFVDAKEELQQTPVTKILSDDLSPRGKRFISGSSQKFDDIIDLNEEFNKALQIREHGYATRQSNQIIVAKSTRDDLLDPAELSKPLVPAVDNANYNQRQQNIRTKYGDRVPSTRIKTPLSSVSGDNKANIQSNRPLVSAPAPVQSRPAAAVRVTSDDYKPGELAMKKREMIKPARKSFVVPNEDVILPKSDHGRLYIHINSLNGVILDQIKYHKATFKIFLDNGKHVISTPKMTLDNNVKIDKEFEIAVEDNVTDIFLTMKINYHTPDQELVEIVEKIPIKSNRLSRIMGLKPKFVYEKKFVTRQKERDDWDDKFANDGSFGKNKIGFSKNDNEVTGKSKNYLIELFNEWETVKQSEQVYKKPAHLVARLDVTMLFIPRTSPLETLPPSIKIGYKIADHLKEQSGIAFEGYLFQEGGDCELWKRRFFKLEGTKFIAHQEITKKPRAQINLLKCIDVLHDGKKTGNNERNFTDEILMSDCFKLKFLNGEIINFNAETKELKEQWISKLEKIVELNKFHQPWVKSLAQNM